MNQITPSINFHTLREQVKGFTYQKPFEVNYESEVIENDIFERINNQNPKSVFTQNEYINDLYLLNPLKIGIEGRNNLSKSPTFLFLLNEKTIESDNPFDEKQNDKANILVVKVERHPNVFYEIIDIKTQNLSKSAQSPNIISAYKLAQVCAKMIDNQEFNTFTIDYFEIDWFQENEKLVCKDAHFVNLFRTNPSQLYINWVAAMQIQFHVCDLTQDFTGNTEEWAKAYLKHFVTQAKRRADEMIKKFVKPFEKYLDK
jgi:hypothetical protein